MIQKPKPRYESNFEKCTECDGSGCVNNPPFMTAGAWVNGNYVTGMKRMCTECHGSGYQPRKWIDKK